LWWEASYQIRRPVLNKHVFLPFCFGAINRGGGGEGEKRGKKPSGGTRCQLTGPRFFSPSSLILREEGGGGGGSGADRKLLPVSSLIRLNFQKRGERGKGGRGGREGAECPGLVSCLGCAPSADGWGEGRKAAKPKPYLIVNRANILSRNRRKGVAAH